LDSSYLQLIRRIFYWVLHKLIFYIENENKEKSTSKFLLTIIIKFRCHHYLFVLKGNFCNKQISSLPQKTPLVRIKKKKIKIN